MLETKNTQSSRDVKPLFSVRGEKMSRQITLRGSPVPTNQEKRKFEEGANRMVFALMAPIITCPGEETFVTGEMKSKITVHRLAAIMKDEDDQATDYEAMVYMGSASLEFPLDQDGFNVYAFLFRKFYPEQAKEIFSEHEGIKLDYTASDLLNGLKRFIYTTQKREMKAREKARGDEKRAVNGVAADSETPATDLLEWTTSK